MKQFEAPKGEIAVIETTMGTMKAMFFPEDAPKCVENWLTHAKEGYYNGLIFHRVIKDFMIQTGDPEGTGMGGESIWGHGIADEYSRNLYHFRGAVCMAKSSLPNSIGSQFYIVQGVEVGPDLQKQMANGGWPAEAVEAYAKAGGYPYLDQRYTVIGQVFEGLDVVEAISKVPTGQADRPKEDVKILSITVENA